MSRASGVPFRTVQRAVNYWNANRRKPPPPCVCGRPFRHSGGCVKHTPGALDRRWIKKIEQMTLAGDTPTEIARELNMHHNTVLKHSLAARQRMHDAGITCGCGRLIGHSHWCSAKWDQYGRHRGRKPLPGGADAEATRRLIAGEPVTAIAEAMRLTVGGIAKLLHSLPDEQKRARAAKTRRRFQRTNGHDAQTLQAKVSAAIPKYVDGSIRDDVVSEIVLAVMEGRIEPEDIGAAVKSFVQRGLGEWQSQRFRSLDAPISADGSLLGDMLGDSTAALSADEVVIGQDGASA